MLKHVTDHMHSLCTLMTNANIHANASIQPGHASVNRYHIYDRYHSQRG